MPTGFDEEPTSLDFGIGAEPALGETTRFCLMRLFDDPTYKLR